MSRVGQRMDIQTRTSQFDAETRHIADNLETGICIIRRIIRINVAVIRVSVAEFDEHEFKFSVSRILVDSESCTFELKNGMKFKEIF